MGWAPAVVFTDVGWAPAVVFTDVGWAPAVVFTDVGRYTLDKSPESEGKSTHVDKTHTQGNIWQSSMDVLTGHGRRGETRAAPI